MLTAGQIFQGYRIEELLDTGGQAAVFRASSSVAGTPPVIALKVLHETHRDPTSTAHLHREFRIAHLLTHRHIITVYEQGPYWMGMDYISTHNATALHTHNDILHVLAQIAAALDHAHRYGIIHTDVKPTNILIHQNFPRDGAILIDFGVAHILAEEVWHRPDHILASLPYAAPELITGHLPQAATDEYALACTAVELLTGTPPFTADNPTALIDAQLNLPPPEISSRTPGLPPALNWVIGRAIAKNPDVRYTSCTELVHQISMALHTNTYTM